MNEKSEILTSANAKRKIPVLSLVVFPISILVYLINYFLFTGDFHWFSEEFLLLGHFAIQITIFVLAVTATVRTARNMSKYKGLGFALTSAILTFIPAVFGPIFFLIFSMTFLR